jgi:ubiquinone/menaquinone biosynthesis C-methylase UbiE
VERFFASTASFWDETYSRARVADVIYQQRRDVALEWLDGAGLSPASRVLDVGCGAGATAVGLAARGFTVDAVDMVDEMIELARRNVTRAGVAGVVTVARGDVQALQFGDETFDAVVALGLIPWLQSPAGGMGEMARVLAPGGALVVTADNAQRLTYLLDPKMTPRLAAARRAIRDLAGVSSQNRAPRRALHSRAEMDALVAGAGLVVERERLIGFGPFTLLGRVLVPGRTGVRLHAWLGRRADHGARRIAARGAQHLVLAHKPDAAVRSTGREP